MTLRETGSTKITSLANEIKNLVNKYVSTHENKTGSSLEKGHVQAGGTPQTIGTSLSAGTDNGYYARADHVHTVDFSDVKNTPDALNVVDDLTTDSGSSPLSAKQGKWLNDNKANISHEHSQYLTSNSLTNYVTTDDSRLSDARTPTSHTHDDRYYTETEVDTKLNGKSDTGHTHSQYLTSHQSLDGKTVTLTKLSTATTGYVATYEIKQGGTSLGKIDIPKDYLVKSGSVKTATSSDLSTLGNGYAVGDKYIDFVINTKDSSGTNEHIYINVKDLVDTYTVATTSVDGLMSSSDKTKLNGIATNANNYTHPSYTARTGKPTANQTPGFGQTATVSQIKSDTSGHVTEANDFTIKIPSSTATTSAAGLMSSSDKEKLNGIATGANNITVDSSMSTTSTNPVQNKIVNSAIDTKTVTVEKQATAESGYTATYVVKQNGTQVGEKINIPKDFLVKSATMKTCSTANSPLNGLAVGDPYLDFVINSKDSSSTDEHIYINVKDLVDTYTAGTGLNLSNSNQFSVKLSSATNSTDETSAATPKAVKTAYDLANGKAPTSHATTATTYGVGTTSNYGHNKLVENLTTDAGNGLALGAGQGKALKAMIDNITTGNVDLSGTHNHTYDQINTTGISGNIDYNDYKTKGQYIIWYVDQQNNTNRPTTSGGLLVVETIPNGVAQYFYCYGANNNQVYYRTYYSPTPTWNNWIRIDGQDKANSTHTHPDGQITLTSSVANGVTPVDMAIGEIFSANRLAFLPPANITIKYSTDNGSTWTDYGADNTNKAKLISIANAADGEFAFTAGKGATASTNNRLLIDIDAGGGDLTSSASDLYMITRKIMIYFSTGGGSNCKVQIQTALYSNPTNFTAKGTYDLGGYAGWNSIPLNITFGGFKNQTDHVKYIRFIFYRTSDAKNFNVQNIRLFGETAWISPSNMATYGHIYKYDIDQNATFPAKIIKQGGTSSQFLKADGSVDSNTYIHTAGTGLTKSTNTLGITNGGVGATQLASNAVETAKIKDANVTVDKFNVQYYGGENLLPNTQQFDTLDTNTNNLSTLTTDYYNNCRIRRVNATSISNNYLDIGWNKPIIGTYTHGDYYTFSFWGKGSGTIIVYLYGATNHIKAKPIRCSSGGTKASGYGDGSCTFTLTNEWKRYYVTWHLSTTNDSSNLATVQKYLRIRTMKNADAYYCGPMFEKGEIPHEWSPSSTDVATTSGAGLMSATDKTKLNGIATGANNYSHPSTHAASMITGLSTVATSGSYADLSNKPSYTATVTSSTTGAYKIGSINISGSNVDIYGKDTRIPTAHQSDTNAYGAATTAKWGHTKLSSATDSSAEDIAATPKAVKAAYDLANGKADSGHSHGWTSQACSNYGTLYINEKLRLCELQYNISSYSVTTSAKTMNSGAIPATYRPNSYVTAACTNPAIQAWIDSNGDINCRSTTAASVQVAFSMMWHY